MITTRYHVEISHFLLGLEKPDYFDWEDHIEPEFFAALKAAGVHAHAEVNRYDDSLVAVCDTWSEACVVEKIMAEILTRWSGKS